MMITGETLQHTRLKRYGDDVFALMTMHYAVRALNATAKHTSSSCPGEQATEVTSSFALHGARELSNGEVHQVN